jgi:hypothetical protein
LHHVGYLYILTYDAPKIKHKIHIKYVVLDVNGFKIILDEEAILLYHVLIISDHLIAVKLFSFSILSAVKFHTRINFKKFSKSGISSVSKCLNKFSKIAPYYFYCIISSKNCEKSSTGSTFSMGVSTL